MKFKRSILVTIFLFLLILLCFSYAYGGYYKDISVIDLLNGNSGNEVMVYGPVTSVYNGGFEVYNVRNSKSYNVKTNLKVNLDSDVYILGTLNSNNEIIITKIMTFSMKGVSNVFLSSFFGLIIFLLVFLKYWKFNPREILFIRRK
ncbi:MAG TPA: hypothetical protein VF324_06825 [Methanobacterium sp.]